MKEHLTCPVGRNATYISPKIQNEIINITAYDVLEFLEREEFLEFGKCTRVTGEAIANQIIHIIEKAGFDITDCRGQGYDGASNM